MFYKENVIYQEKESDKEEDGKQYEVTQFFAYKNGDRYGVRTFILEGMNDDKKERIKAEGIKAVQDMLNVLNARKSQPVSKKQLTDSLTKEEEARIDWKKTYPLVCL